MGTALSRAGTHIKVITFDAARTSCRFLLIPPHLSASFYLPAQYWAGCILGFVLAMSMVAETLFGTQLREFSSL